MRVTLIKCVMCVTGYSFSLRGFGANVSTSDNSDRDQLQICFSTAMTSSASVLSSPDVERVSDFTKFSLLCERSMHADVTGMVAHISRNLYNSEYIWHSFFLVHIS